MQFADKIDQLLDAAAQAIALPHDQGIALAKHFENLGQTRTVRSSTAQFVFKYLMTAGIEQGIPLQFEVLVLR